MQIEMLFRAKRIRELSVLVFLLLFSSVVFSQTMVTGKVTDEQGAALAGVTISTKDSNVTTISDENGLYNISVSPAGTLIFTYIGTKTQEILVNGRNTIDVRMLVSNDDLDEVIIVGYGTRKKSDISSALVSVNADDIGKVHGGATVSTTLAGKMAGVSFRMTDGRPGASANIQIRGMGDPLYIIDDIQQDAGQFNNLAADDIENITILKDAAASIYGSRAGNGVVLVKTKKGRLNQKSVITLGGYYGWQNWTRFPKVVNAYEWMAGKADAEMNFYGRTDITKDELEKWKLGEGYNYYSEDWQNFIYQPNAPQYSVNANASGGSDKINYYVSATHIKTISNLGKLKEFWFQRSNVQSNIEAKVTNRLKVGVNFNGRIETRDQPGVPGADDYWGPRFAIFRNRPTVRAFANNNPLYPNDIGNNAENFALMSKALTGYWRSDWRVMQLNFNAEYQIPGITGLTARGRYSYYMADEIVNGHEYTYQTYWYDPAKDVYNKGASMTNPWRERQYGKRFNNVSQVQLDYNRTFGDHSVSALLANERIYVNELRYFQHGAPKTNILPLLYFNDLDNTLFQDRDWEEARIGYILKLGYNYASRYYIDFAGRRDASWKFAPTKRVGYFPSVSAAWRITQEPWFLKLTGNNSILNELKIRGSYGILGDDNINVDPFAYIPGYVYNAGLAILDGQPVSSSRLKNSGILIDNLRWFESRISDVGLDWGMFSNKLSGTFDYFYRKRTGLFATKYDVLLPSELGYGLPPENVNSDARYGGEMSIKYTNNIKEFKYNIGANFSLSREKFLNSYKPRFSNSWDQYRNSGENRYTQLHWGYEYIGQFQSFEEINNYPVDIDGQGNRTLRPGSLKYKDLNNDGFINVYDERPIGYTSFGTPNMQYGLQINLGYKNFDFTADFSGASMYTFRPRWEVQVPYQNGGNLNKAIYDDRWHRADIFDLNSEWIPGKYPALSFNEGWRSDYWTSTFWLRNVRYLRARTIELGYSLPQLLLQKIKITKARFYVNGYNLFSIDNVKDFYVDPEIADENGLQYPQNRFINIGFNITL